MLLGATRHPAKRLIRLYHERWEEELTIDEIKTHERERPVLRSQTPAGVVQEIQGLLLAHYVVRGLMSEAARQQQLPPRRLSFTGALKVLRCRLPECPRAGWVCGAGTPICWRRSPRKCCRSVATGSTHA